MRRWRGTRSSARPTSTTSPGSNQNGRTAARSPVRTAMEHAARGDVDEGHRSCGPGQRDDRDRTTLGQLTGRHHPQQQGDGRRIGDHHDVTLPIGEGVAAYELVEAVAPVDAGEPLGCQHDVGSRLLAEHLDHPFGLARRGDEHRDDPPQPLPQGHDLVVTDLRPHHEDALEVRHAPTLAGVTTRGPAAEIVVASTAVSDAGSARREAASLTARSGHCGRPWLDQDAARARIDDPGPCCSVEVRGLEPLAFSMRTRRATSCATPPRASWRDAKIHEQRGPDRIDPGKR